MFLGPRRCQNDAVTVGVPANGSSLNQPFLGIEAQTRKLDRIVNRRPRSPPAIAQPVCTHAAQIFTMLPRTLRAIRVRSSAPLLRATFASTATNSSQPNDPVRREVPQNVSETNATATSSEGSFDKVLQEDVATAEQLRTAQAPNYKGVWSRSQNPREKAMSGPRFEQSIMEDQVCQISYC